MSVCRYLIQKAREWQVAMGTRCLATCWFGDVPIGCQGSVVSGSKVLCQLCASGCVSIMCSFYLSISVNYMYWVNMHLTMVLLWLKITQKKIFITSENVRSKVVALYVFVHKKTEQHAMNLKKPCQKHMHSSYLTNNNQQKN